MTKVVDPHLEAGLEDRARGGASRLFPVERSDAPRGSEFAPQNGATCPRVLPRRGPAVHNHLNAAPTQRPRTAAFGLVVPPISPGFTTESSTGAQPCMNPIGPTPQDAERCPPRPFRLMGRNLMKAQYLKQVKQRHEVSSCGVLAPRRVADVHIRGGTPALGAHSHCPVLPSRLREGNGKRASGRRRRRRGFCGSQYETVTATRNRGDIFWSSRMVLQF